MSTKLPFLSVDLVSYSIEIKYEKIGSFLEARRTVDLYMKRNTLQTVIRKTCSVIKPTG